ncbi:hypothetical protein [Xanthobacter variabilis]|uniref:hypothetical protein n=1 Tax=Xanthobacter variabilis TaxID=3119932 RepID=UPI0037288E81
MKKDECEAAIRHLNQEWAGSKGIRPGSIEMPSFSEFTSWLSQKGYGHYLDFRSCRGANADAELWFDQERKQT